MRIDRRQWLGWGVTSLLTQGLWAEPTFPQYEQASELLEQAIRSGQITAAVFSVSTRTTRWSQAFGAARSPDAPFLLGSISKPIAITPLMALVEQGALQLDDPLVKFLPEFTGQGRDRVTLRHLLTHTSGLPDQLPQNAELRRQHAPLSEFVTAALQLPLAFAPGTQYLYSSMGILLACEVAQRLTSRSILQLVQEGVFDRLQMSHSAQGLGRFQLTEVQPVQIEFAAPEAGAGDPTARDWDWNSPYWRALGAPWGGTLASAPDVARFLDEFLFARGRAVRPETARLMTRNHNPPALPPRGLGFNSGPGWCGTRRSPQTFGHTGSTGTIAWADPATETVCVVLTSLPGQAVEPHPRLLVSELF
jgi:CubicO group peptidase (beta-lactamase class C family)